VLLPVLVLLLVLLVLFERQMKNAADRTAPCSHMF
jgi:hypothetical protein